MFLRPAHRFFPFAPSTKQTNKKDFETPHGTVNKRAHLSLTFPSCLALPSISKCRVNAWGKKVGALAGRGDRSSALLLRRKGFDAPQLRRLKGEDLAGSSTRLPALFFSTRALFFLWAAP